MIVARVVSVVIGYVFGLLQTGYLYGKSKGIDIRTEGSGNAGTTNSMRVLGKKAGIITFLGDAFKAIFAVLVVKLIYGETYPDAVLLLELYAGFGAVLGHNFPFYLGFKGGKGIATTAGMIFSVCFPSAPLCLIVFVIAVVTTKYVSVGSILVLITYLVQVIVFGQMGYLDIAVSYLPEFYVVSACFVIMGVWRHRANIKRLMNGTENKVGSKKEK